MLKHAIVPAFAFAALLAASPASAASTFPNTCSNTTFTWNAAALPVIQSYCLKANGQPNMTSMVLMGISNQNGRLVQGTGNSTFQMSCGSIQILANTPNVMLSAYCRTSAGTSEASSLSLNNIGNNNGVLVQQ